MRFSLVTAVVIAFFPYWRDIFGHSDAPCSSMSKPTNKRTAITAATLYFIRKIRTTSGDYLQCISVANLIISAEHVPGRQWI